uniref:Molybdopterin synthase catalytic subunit n=1 Tax=Mola mola TaxID=94237 RepID=A0A3Q3XL89_MOLML
MPSLTGSCFSSEMGESEARRDVFKLSPDWLSVQEVVDAVSSSSCGAISIFIGTTREDKLDGQKVIRLEYEAYELMAQSEFTKLCADIRGRWPSVTHICVHHRLGWVEVGQASVVMAISSPHRHDGQQAIQHCINQLKAKIPIWKKEVYDTQDCSWKENAECPWAAGRKRHPDTSSTENI